ncbi:MAG: tetratricopeptide repeat protein [Phycisphaerae bacterium]|nr:MAG: tetratricopeptide repeat protein [Phycisphaerae bacterium]MBE7457011.1 tetratricopeptide repeat protein [Planctomycetia bacterium]MCK6463630.1 tetratricopeptide repeat protein [Phycisphaerae bacterium]MCL4718299.1 tetratricopeptide repeat protein [Phycisphaerae bacterium]NUQ10572.1 tetratricopeptide repeat protein [Phycisphaerae bacterium]
MPRREAHDAAADRAGAAPVSAAAPTDVPLTRRQHVLLSGVFAAALILRLIYLAGQSAGNPMFAHPIMDMRVHHEWAAQLASGEPLRAIHDKPYFRAPLYYYALGGLYALFGPQVWLGRLAGCVLGAATCYLVARLGSKLAGFAAGLASGLLAAAYWPMWYFDAELKTVGLEVFLDVALLLALLAAQRRGRAAGFVGAGLIWGLSAITRPNVLALLPGFVLWFALMSPRGQRWRKTASAAGFLTLGAVIPILPVTIRNVVVGREFVLIASQGGVNFYIGNNPYNQDGFTAVVPGTRPGWWEGFEDTHLIPERELGRSLSEKEVSDYWFEKSLTWIRSNPATWVRHLLRKLVLFWTPVEVSNNQPISFFAGLSGLSWAFWIGFPVVTCLAAAGLTCITWRDRRWLLLLAFLLFYMGTVVLFFCPGRYRLPVVPVLLVLAGAGAVAGVDAVRRRAYRALSRSGAAAGVAAAAMIFNPTPSKDRRADARVAEAEGHAILSRFFEGEREGSPRDPERSLEHMRSAVELRPDDAFLRWRLGRLLALDGRDAQAEEQFRKGAALASRARDPEPLYRYGEFLLARKRPDEALAQFEAALRIQPAYTEASAGADRARAALRQAGDSDEAIAEYRAALQTNPDDLATLIKLGGALVRRDRADEAVAPLERALSLAPGNSTVRQALAEAYRRKGRRKDAIRVLSEAESLASSAVLQTALAWLLATSVEDELRDGRRALELARRAEQSAGSEVPQVLDALAAALAETGDFAGAKATADRAADLARRQRRTTLAEAIRNRAAMYAAGRPFREDLASKPEGEGTSEASEPPLPPANPASESGADPE